MFINFSILRVVSITFHLSLLLTKVNQLILRKSGNKINTKLTYFLWLE